MKNGEENGDSKEEYEETREVNNERFTISL